MYSYGDSTPFPLRENFLDTLMATVRTCAALFACECEQTAAKAKVRSLRSEADIELANLNCLQNDLSRSFASAQGTASGQVAKHLSEAAAQVLSNARSQLTTRRDGAISQATNTNLSERIHQLLSDYLLSNQLPYTKWSFQWRTHEGVVEAKVNATTKETSADFSTKAAGESIWTAPIELSSLFPGVTLAVPHWGRRSKGTETRPYCLDSCQITQVESSQVRQRLVLQRPGKSKHDICITLADIDLGTPTIVLVDPEGQSMGETHQLAEQEVQEISKLWNLLLEQRSHLIETRNQLIQLSLHRRSLSDFSSPSELAEILLQIVAPLIREIRMRSRMPGELILKQERGKGRREEIFMSRQSLREQYESLPEQYQRVFDAMGLGNESTCDFITLHGNKAPASTATRAATPAPRRNRPIQSVVVDIDAA